MSGGTVTQLLSQDAQDLNLTGGQFGSTNVLSTGSFQTYWNMPTRTGGNRANWSPLISSNSQKLKQQGDNLVTVNVPGILSAVPNSVFPRVNPKSTVSSYPDIDNILVNQKEDNDLMERELSNEMLRDNLPPRFNTLRSDSLNTLQNTLINRDCSKGKCGIPMSHPKPDSVATNKVDAHSIGDLSEETEHGAVENFDSGVSYSTIPTKVHNKLRKRLVRRQENFDSGLSSHTMPLSVHDNLSNKLVKASVKVTPKNSEAMKSARDNEFKRLTGLVNNKVEHFDSGLNCHTMPTRVHNQIKKKVVRRQEDFDSGLMSHNIPSSVHENLSGRLVKKNQVFAKVNDDIEENDDHEVEHFDSGVSCTTMPTRIHNQIKKKLVKRQENFDSGLSSHTMPLSIHENLSGRLVKKNQIFAKVNGDDEELENFDSGLSASSKMSVKMHNKINNKLNCKSVRRQENFDSGISSHTMPSSVHNKLTKKMNKDKKDDKDYKDDKDDDYEIELVLVGTTSSYPIRPSYMPVKRHKKTGKVEHFNNNDDVLRAATGNCENCPQGRCVNCPHRQQVCKDCPLGYPCKSCAAAKFLNNRDQIVDSDEKKEHFGCACKRKVKLISATDLNQNRVPEDMENFECSLNPDSNECNQCSKCPSCRNSQCPTCPKDNKQQVSENFSSVGFDTLCPCSAGRCTNCPLCRAGNCPDCPKSKQDNTYIDLASLGNWAGGYRLGGDWNDATRGPEPVNIGNNVTFYPDSYVGSYFINPKPDISYPYAVIPPSRTVSGIVLENNHK